MVGLIAGGREALLRAVEGAEDSPENGVRDLKGIDLTVEPGERIGILGAVLNLAILYAALVFGGGTLQRVEHPVALGGDGTDPGRSGRARWRS